MDWTELITALIAAVSAIGGSALVQSKATAVLEVRMDALKENVAALSERMNEQNQLQNRVLKLEWETAHAQQKREAEYDQKHLETMDKGGRHPIAENVCTIGSGGDGRSCDVYRSELANRRRNGGDGGDLVGFHELGRIAGSDRNK